MSSYLKNGQRQAKLAERKKTKAHVKAFYNILGQMDVVAKQLDPTLEYNEDNINEYVNPIIGRDLDSMEKMLVLGKLHYAKEDIKNIEVKSELKQSEKYSDILEVMEGVRDLRIETENKLNETKDNN